MEKVEEKKEILEKTADIQDNVQQNNNNVVVEESTSEFGENDNVEQQKATEDCVSNNKEIEKGNKELEEKIQNLENKIKEYELENKIMQDAIKEVDKIKDDVDADVENFKKYRDNLRKYVSSYYKLEHKEKKISNLESENSKLKEYKNKYEEYEDKCEKKEAKIKSLKQDKLQLESDKTSLNEKYNEQLNIIKKHEEQLSNFLNIRCFNKNAENWVQVLNILKENFASSSECKLLLSTLIQFDFYYNELLSIVNAKANIDKYFYSRPLIELGASLKIFIEKTDYDSLDLFKTLAKELNIVFKENNIPIILEVPTNLSHLEEKDVEIRKLSVNPNLGYKILNWGIRIEGEVFKKPVIGG